MTEHKQIISDTIDGPKDVLRDSGNLTVSTIHFDAIKVIEGNEESLFCAYVETEWGEAIYYNLPTQCLFFYEEPRTFSNGGRQLSILIEGSLLDFIPPALLELPTKVAKTGVALDVPLNVLPTSHS